MTSIRIPVPAVGFCPPTYLCRRARLPFEPDGRLDKPFWRDAPWTEPFTDIEGPIRPAPRFLTRAKLLWDDTCLYVGAQLDGDEIWGHVTRRDDVIFRDNDFEIFIDPDSDTQQYYEFEMNVLNTVWDLFLPIAYRDGGSALNGFDIHGLRTAVHVDGAVNDPSAPNRAWSVEVAIPFAAINECIPGQPTPRPGDYYRLNFSRVQWKVDRGPDGYRKQTGPNGAPLPEDNWVWAPTGVVNIHYPELWGFIFFADENGQGTDAAIPEDERRKWELRKLYYAQQIHKDETGHYTADLAALQAILARCALTDANRTLRADLPFSAEVTAHGFEFSCPAQSGGTLVLTTNGKISRMV